jgi:hypothetical protein
VSFLSFPASQRMRSNLFRMGHLRDSFKTVVSGIAV